MNNKISTSLILIKITMKSLLIFCCAFSLTFALDLPCTFKVSPYTNIGYQCDASTLAISSKNDRTITKILGTHLSGKTHESVNAFYNYNGTIRYSPTQIGKFFTNLKVFESFWGYIVEVTAEELKDFPKLESLRFDYNYITYIGPDAFKNNPLLGFINLNGNRIMQVAPGVFNGLVNLNYMNFNSLCVAKQATDRASVLLLIAEIEKNCSYSIHLQYEQLKDAETLESKMISLKNEIIQFKSSKKC